jgi:hypothetical protein
MEVPAKIMTDVSGYLITLRKREVTGNWGRKHKIALFRELTLEEANEACHKRDCKINEVWRRRIGFRVLAASGNLSLPAASRTSLSTPIFERVQELFPCSSVTCYEDDDSLPSSTDVMNVFKYMFWLNLLDPEHDTTGISKNITHRHGMISQKAGILNVASVRT